RHIDPQRRSAVKRWAVCPILCARKRRSPQHRHDSQSTTGDPNPHGSVPLKGARVRHMAPASTPHYQCDTAMRCNSPIEGRESLGMPDKTLTDPLAWRPIKAPSVADMELLARKIFAGLPDKFRSLCEGLIIRVEDFAPDDVLDDLDIESEFDLMGLFQGVG